MKLSILESIGLVFIDSFLVYTCSKKVLIQSSNVKLRLLLLGVFAAILLGLHWSLFFEHIKEPNYYDLLGIGRVYDTNALSKKARQALSMYHPDKMKDADEQFQMVGQVRGILLNPLLSGLYDSMGNMNHKEVLHVDTSNEKQAGFLTQRLQLTAYVECIAFYSILFIIQLVSTYGNKFQLFRIFSTIMIGGLLLQEIMIISQSIEHNTSGITSNNTNLSGDINDVPQKRNRRFQVNESIYDGMFPQLAYFEVLQLLRVMSLALLTCVRLFFDVTGQEKVNSYEDKLDTKIDQLNQMLFNQTQPLRMPNPLPQNGSNTAPTGQDPNQIPPTTRVFELDKFANNTVLLKEIKSLAKKHKQDQPKDGKIISLFKKTIKYLLFALFASQVIFSAIAKSRK